MAEADEVKNEVGVGFPHFFVLPFVHFVPCLDAMV
jgi:hypothetical protein